MGPLLYCWGGADPTSSDQARSLAPHLPAKRLVAQTDRLPPIPTGKSAPSVPFWGRRRRRLASGANSRARRWPIGDLDALASRRSFCAGAIPNGTFERAQRLEWPAGWLCRRAPLLPETHSTTPASHKQPAFLGTRAHSAGNPGSTLARGWEYLNRRPWSKDNKASPAELLAPCSRRSGRWQAENPNSPPESVGSPQKGAIQCLNNPPRSRDWCQSEPGER
jgi:hypothetical protein